VTRIAQPAEVAERNGALQHNPQRFSNGGAKADGPLGDPPAGSSPEFAAIWAEIAGNAIPGVLTVADRIIFEQIVALFEEFRADRARFTAAKHGKLAALLAHLGMTPSGRRGVSPPSGAKPAAPKAGFDDF